MASATAFPFRVGKMVCFGACDPRDANKKRDSVQFTFAATVRRWTEREAFMSAKKPLFFASLHKLLSLEKESKLSLYSLTAVFFCGSKRKRYKKSCGSHELQD